VSSTTIRVTGIPYIERHEQRTNINALCSAFKKESKYIQALG
jgi:hypothetical protein